MFGKNSTQENFKRQIKEIEKDLLKKEKENTGAFTNSLYKERFYGYTESDSSSNSKGTIFIRILKFIFSPVGATLAFIFVFMFYTMFFNTSGDMNAAYENGDYEKAIEYSDKILDKEPNNYDALLTKGVSLLCLENYEEALKVLKLAENFNPDADLYYHLGYTCYELEKYSEAVEYFDKATLLSDDFIEAYIFKGYSLVELQEFDEAKECAEVIEKYEKNNPYAFNIRGLIETYNGNYDEGIDYFRKATMFYKDEGKFEAAHINIAWALYNQKKYSECIKYCNGMKTDLPYIYDFPFYMGDCYSALGEHEMAISAYEEANKLVSDDIVLLVSIGWEYYYLEDYTKAAQYANKALSINKENYYAKNLDEYVVEAKKPEAERIVNFIRNNYLYLDEVKDFEQMAQKFMEIKEVTLLDIYEFLEYVRREDDYYTFFIFDEFYKELLEEELNNKIEHKALSDKIQYVRINTFTLGIDEQFREVVNKIPNPQEQTLVIDLRDNPGGLSDTANSILDILLPECVTSYMVDRDGEIYPYNSDEDNIAFKHIYIFVNEESASSSELLTLGLKTYLNNVTVIGKPTVGKGVGQTVFENKNKNYMIFLVECYWNIKEKNVSDKKIQPDIRVKGNELSDYINAMNAHIN